MRVPIRTLCSITIGADEARYILASYGPDGTGVRFTSLYERAGQFTRMLWEEEYFQEEDGRWDASKWQGTDFIIQKDPGPVTDRITDLRDDEQRLVTPSWWLVNICQQLEALQLWFQRPVDAEPQFDFVPPSASAAAVEAFLLPPPAEIALEEPVYTANTADAGQVAETTAVESSEDAANRAIVVNRTVSPEILERIEQSRRQKALWSGKRAAQTSPMVGAQVAPVPTPPSVDVAKLLPTQKTRMLRLRPAEVVPFYESFTSWREGVQFSEIKAKLGDELATVLLEHHFLVETEVAGRVVMNLLMFAAVDFAVNNKKPRLAKMTPSSLCNKGVKERLQVLVKQLSPVTKPEVEKPVSKPLATMAPVAKPSKGSLPEHLGIWLTCEETEALRNAVSKWAGAVPAEDMKAALGEVLFRGLSEHGYIVNHDNGTHVVLNELKFAATILNPRQNQETPAFGLESGLLPSTEIALAQRLRRLHKSWRKALAREAKEEGKSSSWTLYLKIEEIQALSQDLDKWRDGVTWIEVQALFGDEVAAQLSEQEFILQSKKHNERWILNESLLAETSIQVWIDSRRRTFRAASEFNTNKTLLERFQGLAASFGKKARKIEQAEGDN